MKVSHDSILDKIEQREALIKQIQALGPIGPFKHPDNARREMEFNAFFVYAQKKLNEIIRHEEQVYSKETENESC